MTSKSRIAVRPAFTLVELLVTMSLLVVLAGMAVMIIPKVSDGQYTTRAASQLQQWIEIAKQRAAAKRGPCGIRLLPGEKNLMQVTRLEYIEQPDSYHLGSVPDPASGALGLMKQSVASVPAAGSTTVNFTNNSKTLTGGLPADRFPVQPGDYIELAGMVYRIATVTNNITLTLTSPVPTKISTTNYRIIRQPRPMANDDSLDMAQNVIIDLMPRGIGGGKWDLPAITPTQPLDIMFAPNGRVLGPVAAYDKIILWVRDVTSRGAPGEAAADGDPTLIVIYPSTGLVAAQPVDTAQLLTSPYTFTLTGRRSSD